MKAILLAGGKGTRLRPLTLHTPKPIVPIFNRPFLHYQIDLLKQVPGLNEVILSLNYQPRRIEDVFGDGRSVGLPIRFSLNVPVLALAKLPLATLISQHRPKASNWPGLVLEISEDEIMQYLMLVQRIEKELRPHGISFAVDDFGRAYSAIQQAKDITFAELKIDRSFVANCDSDRMNAGLCETIIALARRLGSKAVAEGVETVLEMKALQRMGCDLGQGYIFARPMPRDHFLNLLRERGKGRTGS